MELPVERITAEVLAADYASVADGKLTLVGAGFDWFNGTGPLGFGIGVLVHVPWSETNTEHVWHLRLVDSDGRAYQGPDGQPLVLSDRFEMGRPPGTPAGAALTAALAFNFQGLVFEAGTRYLVEFLLDDDPVPLGSASFSVRS